MATKIWEGKAIAKAQNEKVAVSGYDGATQYRIDIGGLPIATASGKGSAAATVNALVSGFNASTHPYARVITAAATGGTGTELRLTADVAGNPFAYTAVACGGTSTWGTPTVDQANVSPNDWSDGDNWADGSAPASADDVIFRDSAVSVYWGLDQAAVDLALLAIEQSFTGKIGLARGAFVTGANGAETEEAPEYRDDYLDIGWDVARIGENLGPGFPNGAGRLKLDNDKAGASETEIYNTASVGVDGDLPAVRLLLAHASANLQVRQAPGGVGVAVDEPGETSTMGDVNVSDPTPAARVFLGEGVTFDNFTQQGGNNLIRAAAAVTGVTVLGGDLAIEGDQQVATLNVWGGTVRPHNVPSAGAAVTTINQYGGTIDGTGSRQARTWSTVNLQRADANLVIDPDVVTVTTLNAPTDSGAYTLTVG